jgi:predicted NUDIX family NTP pyrophosphohydrolase
VSAGLLLYRLHDGQVEVLLAHPGGPFWTRRDAGAWTIPKGEVAPGEEPLATARREFEEETGHTPAGSFVELTPVTQRAGKRVYAWACEAGDFDPRALRSNTFRMEWPPRSGTMAEFPEIDRVEFFSLRMARDKINPAQALWLDELPAKLAARAWSGA